MALGLELDDLGGPFHPKPFHDSICWWKKAAGKARGHSVWDRGKEATTPKCGFYAVLGP